MDTSSLNFMPILARWHQIFTFQSPTEVFIFSLILFIIFVIVKHLLFHTFYYYFQRSGRTRVTQIFNKISSKSLTERILGEGVKFSSVAEVHQCVRQFAEARYFERVPSLLDQRKAACFEKYVSEAQKVLLFLDDNGGEELWRLLKICGTSEKREIFVVLDHLANSTQVTSVLQKVIKSGILSSNIKVSIVTAKSGLALLGEFDVIYFGHHPSNYLSSLAKIEEHMQPAHSALLANHVVQGQDDGALDFLMHVRRNPNKYETDMQIASLECTTYDKMLLDGIEIVRLVKQ